MTMGNIAGGCPLASYRQEIKIYDKTLNTILFQIHLMHKQDSKLPLNHSAKTLYERFILFTRFMLNCLTRFFECITTP